MRIYGGVLAFFLLQCLVVAVVPDQDDANATPFQIGISVPETAITTNTCTDEERAFIAEKVAKYTATLVRVFFKDNSLVVDPEETSSGEVDSSYFDTAAFDDFNNFQAKKVLNAAVAGELDGLVNVAPVDGNSIADEESVGRQLSAGASDDASSIQGEPQYDKHRKLFIRYNFRWGVRSRWQCTGCTGDNADGRKRNLAMGWADADLNQYLVVALESVISFSLSMDLQWEVQDWLEQNNLPYGCLGNGDDLNVIFQLI